MFELKPDYETTKKRFDAFWECEMFDHPPASLPVKKDNSKTLPSKNHDSHEERWLDIDFRVELEYTKLLNTKFLGDSLPVIWPNMGPEIFSAL